MSLPRFVYVFAKDMRLFFRRRTSTLFIVLSPLLIILFLGTLFGGYGKVGGGLPTAVCNYDVGDAGNQYVQLLKDYGFFKITDYRATFANFQDCEKFAELNVGKGVFAVGLAYPPDFTQRITDGDSSTLRVFIDNSKPSVRELGEAYIKAVNQQVSTRISSEFILQVWNRLRESDKKVVELQKNVPLAISNLEKLDTELSKLRNEIAQLDVSAIEASKNQLRQSINDLRMLGNSASATISEIESSLSSAAAAVDEADQKAQLAMNSLNSVIDSTRFIEYYVCVNPSATECQQAHNAYSGALNAGSQVNIVMIKTRDTKTALLNENYAVSTAKSRLSEMNQKINEVDAQLAVLEQNLPRVAETRQNALTKFDESHGLVQNILVQLRDLQAYLAETHEQIVYFTSKDPVNIVVPIRLDWAYSFSWTVYKEIDFFIYGIIAIILAMSALLLPAVNLIRERASGVFMRNLITPTGALSIVLGKHLGALFLIGIEFAIVWLAASRYLGVTLSGPFEAVLAAVLLMSSAFVSTGLVIASLTKSENSAILAIITITIPLIFVSGVIVPFEFMPPAVQAATSYLPSTLGINAVKLISLYGTTPSLGLQSITKLQLNAVDYAMLFLAAEAIALFALSVILIEWKGRK
ncbi:MAG: ABC transporter permease [Candidatus Micrarchaeota archaeon]|nr:ABC transporter permease [Candidatus Micrarchaeota archaeon]